MPDLAARLDDTVYRLAEIAERLAHHLEQREHDNMAIDLTALTAAITETGTIAAELPNAFTEAGAAAVISNTKADQAAVDAQTAELVTNNAAASAAIATATAGDTPPTTGLTVTPTAVDFTAGTAGSVALTLSGGTAPYTASGLPTGVTFDGSNLVGDTTTTAGDTTATISDGATPPATAEVSITIE